MDDWGKGYLAGVIATVLVGVWYWTDLQRSRRINRIESELDRHEVWLRSIERAMSKETDESE